MYFSTEAAEPPRLYGSMVSWRPPDVTVSQRSIIVPNFRSPPSDLIVGNASQQVDEIVRLFAGLTLGEPATGFPAEASVEPSRHPLRSVRARPPSPPDARSEFASSQPSTPQSAVCTPPLFPEGGPDIPVTGEVEWQAGSPQLRPSSPQLRAISPQLRPLSPQLRPLSPQLGPSSRFRPSSHSSQLHRRSPLPSTSPPDAATAGGVQERVSPSHRTVSHSPPPSSVDRLRKFGRDGSPPADPLPSDDASLERSGRIRSVTPPDRPQHPLHTPAKRPLDHELAAPYGSSQSLRRIRSAHHRFNVANSSSAGPIAAQSQLQEPSVEPDAPIRPLTLRWYQEEAVQQCREALRRGYLRCAIMMPTGSGKTNVMVAIARIVESPPMNPVEKVLFIVCTTEQAHQLVPAIAKVNGVKSRVGLHVDGERPDGDEPFVVASWQSLIAMSDEVKGYKQYNPSSFKAVMVDECHHAASDSLREILYHFNCDVDIDTELSSTLECLRVRKSLKDHTHRVPIIGVTATLLRNDKKDLEWVFKWMVSHIKVEELERHGFLCPLVFQSEPFNTSTESIRETPRNHASATSTPAIPEANLALEIEALDQDNGNSGDPPSPQKSVADSFVAKRPSFHSLVATTYIDRLHNTHPPRPTLIFAQSVKSVDAIVKLIEAAAPGINAGRPRSASDGLSPYVRGITGQTPALERVRAINAFKKKEFPVLVSCLALAEGTDLPVTQTVMLARAISSQVVFSQMIGRGRRPEDGKTHCDVIDFFNSHAKMENDPLPAETIQKLEFRIIETCDSATDPSRGSPPDLASSRCAQPETSLPPEESTESPDHSNGTHNDPSPTPGPHPNGDETAGPSPDPSLPPLQGQGVELESPYIIPQQ